MIKWIAIILVAGVAAALLLPKLFTSSTSSKTDVKSGPPGAGKTISVQGYVVEPTTLDNVLRTAGTVLAGEEVDIVSEITGKVTTISFREGSTVSKGQLLVKLNDADLRAQMKKAEYNLELSKQKEQRQKSLLGIEGISQQEYDMALNEVNTIGAEIDLLKAQIAKTEIRAPFSGTIGLKSISEGSYISPSMVIASLTSTQSMKIDFSVPEQYAPAVRKGDEVTFTIQGSSREHKAKIYAIEPLIDQTTRTLQLRALYTGGGDVYPGAFVEVAFPLQTAQQALLVPTQALVPDIKGQKVFVYRNGKAVDTPVQAGTRTDKFIQILSGLQPGDTVLTTGLLQIRADVSVKMTSVERGGQTQ